MDERGHYERFKRLHRAGMSVAEVERGRFTSSNGRSSGKPMQDVLEHLPDSLPASRHWRERFRSWRHRLERQWEPIRVNKHIDSVTMPKWIASAILVSMLAFIATSWWRLSDQRDMLIELKTEVKLAKESEIERSKQLREQAELNKVYIDNMTAQLNVIKGMLSAQQLNVVENRKGSN